MVDRKLDAVIAFEKARVDIEQAAFTGPKEAKPPVEKEPTKPQRKLTW